MAEVDPRDAGIARLEALVQVLIARVEAVALPSWKRS